MSWKHSISGFWDVNIRIWESFLEKIGMKRSENAYLRKISSNGDFDLFSLEIYFRVRNLMTCDFEKSETVLKTSPIFEKFAKFESWVSKILRSFWKPENDPKKAKLSLDYENSKHLDKIKLEKMKNSLLTDTALLVLNKKIFYIKLNLPILKEKIFGFVSCKFSLKEILLNKLLSKKLWLAKTKFSISISLSKFLLIFNFSGSSL